MKIEQQLNRAERLFLDKDYSSALMIYANILSHDSNNIDAYIGALLSDLGSDFKEETQVLYYYFQSIKETSTNIKKTLKQLANDLYQAKEEDIFDLIDADLELQDSIDYEDFLSIVDEKANFKEAFEDAIFSTKVVISQKWQFIDFIKKLTDNGYYSVALDYLETHAIIYENDQDILTLYSLLPKGKI